MRCAWLWFAVGVSLVAGCGAQGSAPPPLASGPALERAPDASELDRLVELAWTEQGVTATADIDDATYLRRVTLDLAGRVPTSSEARAFLADTASDKRPRAVARLLSSDDHAAHLARVWEHVLLGPAVKNKLIDRGALRNWLEQKFRADTAWDVMARELVTAEGKNSVGGARGPATYAADPARATQEQAEHVNGATNYTLRFAPNPGDLAGHVSRSFLGVQIQCAQCHDHKTEAWKQDDFRSFSAIFARVTVNPIDRTKGELPIVELASADHPPRRFMRKNEDVALLARTAPRALDGTPLPSSAEARSAFASWMTAPENPWFSRAIVNRVWAELIGDGFVDPVDDMRSTNPARLPAVLSHLAEGFEAHRFDLDWLYSTICASRAYSRAVGATGPYGSFFSSAALRPLSGDVLLDSMFVAADVQALLDERAPERAVQIKALARRRMSFVFEDDAESNAESFDGTLQQAFFAMNGVLPVAATTYAQGTLLERLLATDSDDAVIEELYLRALGRYPSGSELARARAFVLAAHEADPGGEPPAGQGRPQKKLKGKAKRQPPADAGIPARALRSQADSDRERGFEDLFWVLLNSSEFAFRR